MRSVRHHRRLVENERVCRSHEHERNAREVREPSVEIFIRGIRGGRVRRRRLELVVSAERNGVAESREVRVKALKKDFREHDVTKKVSIAYYPNENQEQILEMLEVTEFADGVHAMAYDSDDRDGIRTCVAAWTR